VRRDELVIGAAKLLRVDRIQAPLVRRDREEEWILDVRGSMQWLQGTSLCVEMKRVDRALVARGESGNENQGVVGAGKRGTDQQRGDEEWNQVSHTVKVLHDLSAQSA